MKRWTEIVVNHHLFGLNKEKPETLKNVLDTKNYVVHIERVYQGSVNMSVVRAAEVFRAAVSRNTPSVIIVHNHPSGDPTPSVEDIRTTEQLVQAGKHLDIEVLDHIIIGHQRDGHYYLN